MLFYSDIYDVYNASFLQEALWEGVHAAESQTLKVFVFFFLKKIALMGLGGQNVFWTICVLHVSFEKPIPSEKKTNY
jgi:hypothetical protein